MGAYRRGPKQVLFNNQTITTAAAVTKALGMTLGMRGFILEGYGGSAGNNITLGGNPSKDGVNIANQGPALVNFIAMSTNILVCNGAINAPSRLEFMMFASNSYNPLIFPFPYFLLTFQAATADVTGCFVNAWTLFEAEPTGLIPNDAIMQTDLS